MLMTLYLEIGGILTGWVGELMGAKYIYSTKIGCIEKNGVGTSVRDMEGKLCKVAKIYRFMKHTKFL